MVKQTVTVGSKLGLHARPAAVIARAAGEFEQEVTLQVAGGSQFNAASAMMIIVSGATCGTEITVESPDPQAVARIAELIASDLDANPDLLSGAGSANVGSDAAPETNSEQ